MNDNQPDARHAAIREITSVIAAYHAGLDFLPTALQEKMVSDFASKLLAAILADSATGPLMLLDTPGWKSWMGYDEKKATD